MTRKLPDNVYYTRCNGGMYVSWNGRPEGPIHYTYDREVARASAWTLDTEWIGTPYQGADGRCRIREVIRLAAGYAA